MYGLLIHLLISFLFASPGQSHILVFRFSHLTRNRMLSGPQAMAPPKETKFKVGAAHAAPIFMNKAATIKKTVLLIEQAAADDIKLLVFPETFIPGYPVGLTLALPVGARLLVAEDQNVDRNHSTGPSVTLH